MLCFGLISVTNDFCKKHQNCVYNYAVECISSNENGLSIFRVALGDFTNVRIFSRSANGEGKNDDISQEERSSHLLHSIT